MSTPPDPDSIEIYRLIHLDSLETLLRRGALHAPNRVPEDGLPYRSIHDPEVQVRRRSRPVPVGPMGVAADYVPFYFGRYSVMLLKLHTGEVPGYDGGQRDLVHLVCSVGALVREAVPFVFTDGHGLARMTRWFDSPHRLDAIDWELVRAKQWADTDEDNDRKRRKQAELLVWQRLDWALLGGLAVYDAAVAERVQGILGRFPKTLRKPVKAKRAWYY